MSQITWLIKLGIKQIGLWACPLVGREFVREKEIYVEREIERDLPCDECVYAEQPYRLKDHQDIKRHPDTNLYGSLAMVFGVR